MSAAVPMRGVNTLPTGLAIGPGVALRLDPVTVATARAACERWHYSRKSPSGKTLSFGVWEGGRFVGVVSFGRGASHRLGGRYGLGTYEVCELVRVALRDHLHLVSRIVAIALRLLKMACPGLRLVVSFADPEYGHRGTIYRAGNWVYAGRTLSKDEYLVHGVRYHGRTLRHKKPSRMTTIEYARSLDPHSRFVCGSSKFRFLYPLDRSLELPALPYPRVESIDGDAPLTPERTIRFESEIDAIRIEISPRTRLDLPPENFHNEGRTRGL
jgi:hypothetical protein